jgi:hypothetical protein
MTKGRLRPRQFSSWSSEGRIHLAVESNPDGPPRQRFHRSVFDMPVSLTAVQLHELAEQLGAHLIEGDQERAALASLIEDDFDLTDPTPVASLASAFTSRWSAHATSPEVAVERTVGSAQLLCLRVFTADTDVCFSLDAASARQLVQDLLIAADATEALERNPKLAFALNLSHPTEETERSMEGASLQ